MRRAIPAAMLSRERLVALSHAARQIGQVLQPVGDDVDYLAFALHLAMAGDHARRQHQPPPLRIHPPRAVWV
jgi:hypothetical protein